MKIRTSLNAALIVLLASCTTVSIAPTATKAPITTPLFTQTSVPSTTTTPLLAATNTVVVYSSELYSNSLFSEQLSSLILNPPDVPVLDINYLQLIAPEVKDLTNEIQNCGNDCVKTVWKEKKIEGGSEQQLSITLIRMDSDLLAAESVNAGWAEFSQVEPGINFTEGEIYFFDRLPNNSKVGIRDKEPNVEVMFTASRGPVYMRLVHNFRASSDLVLDFAGIQQMAILQLEKLEAAGYPK